MPTVMVDWKHHELGNGIKLGVGRDSQSGDLDMVAIRDGESHIYLDAAEFSTLVAIGSAELENDH